MNTGSAVEKQAGREVGRQEPTRGAPYYRPPVDIVETGEELRVVADMPGTRTEDIDIRFEGGVLTLHGKVSPRRYGSSNPIMQEYGIGNYYRAFEVSEAVDANGITAEYSDGVLTLHLPKAEKVKARKIEVRTK